MESTPLSCQDERLAMVFGLAMDNGPQEILRLPSQVLLHTSYIGTLPVLGTEYLCSSMPGRVVVGAGLVPTRLYTVHEEYHKSQQRGIGHVQSPKLTPTL
jgi:hypothetical protein